MTEDQKRELRESKRSRWEMLWVWGWIEVGPFEASDAAIAGIPIRLVSDSKENE